MSDSTTLKIEGMHCDGCVRRVRAALQAVNGINVKDVRVGSADIETNAGDAGVEGAIDAINDIGFSAQAN